MSNIKNSNHLHAKLVLKEVEEELSNNWSDLDYGSFPFMFFIKLF